MKIGIIALLFFVTSAAATPAAVETVDWNAWAAETRTLLEQAVGVDTVNPPGNEEAVCKLFRDALAKDGIAADVLVSAPGRANLVARLPATGPAVTTQPPKPVLWLAHLDVVGVAGQDWTVPPLKATEKDGYLYGRGTIDDKGMAVLGVQLFRLIKRTGAAHTHPLELLLTADEESSAHAGVGWLLKEHRDLFDVAFAINEGGHLVTEDGRVKFVEVQTAEKIYVDLKLSATGESGHSSLPVADNAIWKLSRALARLADKHAPVELSETSRGMLAGIAQGGGAEAAAIRRLLAGGAAGRAAGAKLAASPYFNALLRTTFVATMLEGGTRVNVLPAKASANVNCRILPGTDSKAFIRQLEQWIADAAVKVTYDAEELVDVAASPVQHPFFDAVRKVAQVHFPGAIVMPSMSPGATDSRFLRALKIPAYGLLPFPLAREDTRRMHAADERLPLASIVPGLRFGHDLLVEAAR